MKYNYCTLFDSGYLDRGVLLINSLLEVENNFTLFVLALDRQCEDVLKGLSFKNVEIISITEFVDSELAGARVDRSWKSFCWTCQGALPEYVMRVKGVDNVIYMDADMKFYLSPNFLVDDLKKSGNSVAISPHNFPNNIYGRHYKKFCGKYCSGFVLFINDQVGYTIAKEWRTCCIKECTDSPEGGTFGDQYYLEQWEKKHKRVKVIENEAIGMAPWNIMNYYLNNGVVTLRKTKEPIDPVFYHFHGSSFISEKKVYLNIYSRQGKIDDQLVDYICRPYFAELYQIKRMLNIEYAKGANNVERAQEQTNKKNIIKNYLKNDIIYLLLTKFIILFRGKKKDVLNLDN